MNHEKIMDNLGSVWSAILLPSIERDSFLLTTAHKYEHTCKQDIPDARQSF